MRGLVLALTLMIASAACAADTDDPNREAVVRPPPSPQAWIHVDVVQTACCYDEGSTDVLEITDRDGFRMAELAFANKEPLGEDEFVGRFEPVAVDLGPHTVMVWQEDCGGGCRLDEGGDNSFLIESAGNDSGIGKSAEDIAAAPYRPDIEAADILKPAKRWVKA